MKDGCHYAAEFERETDQKKLVQTLNQVFTNVVLSFKSRL